MMRMSRLAALSTIVIVTSVGTTAGPWTDTVGSDAACSQRLTTAACAALCEPNDPSPAGGATDVPVDTQLSWKVPQPEGCDRFRILASTGGIGENLHPFGLVELAAMAKRGLMLDRLALREDEIAAEDGQTRFAADGGAAPILHAAAAQGRDGVTCDVYLDTVNPPVKLACQDVLPPIEGEVWTCNPGILRPDMTYYWTVVAKNGCGATKAGGVWSFKTKGPIFEDTFSSTTIDSTKWAVVKGAAVDEKGLNEPSAPYSLRLNAYPSGGDSVESGVIDLSGYSTVTLSYCYQQGGGGDSPEETDDLIVEYHDCDRWVELSRQLGKDPETDTFKCVTLELPAAALTSCFKLRFRSVGTAPNGGLFVNDDWFVDDVTLYSN